MSWRLNKIKVNNCGSTLVPRGNSARYFHSQSGSRLFGSFQYGKCWNLPTTTHYYIQFRWWWWLLLLLLLSWWWLWWLRASNTSMNRCCCFSPENSFRKNVCLKTPQTPGFDGGFENPNKRSNIQLHSG